MKYLRTNTAVRVAVGPFLDYSDGVTPETGITVTNTTCEMFTEDDDGTGVNRTAITLAASGTDNDMIHIPSDVAGYYDLELTAAQLNVLGRMTLVFTDPDVHRSVNMEYMVLPANVYDSMFSTDKLQVDVTQWLGTAVAAPDVAGVPTVAPAGVRKNVALSNFVFLMVDSTNHLTPKAGLTVTGTISLDGGAFAALTNSVVEIANGFYKVSGGFTQAEMNADVVALRFIASGADQRSVIIFTSK